MRVDKPFSYLWMNLQAHQKLSQALAEIISDFLDRQLPLRRIVFVASILKICNIETPDQDRLSRRLSVKQNDDGGWIDCEDTSWSIYFLSGRKDFESDVRKGLRWLENERIENKGWGFCKRDNPCIPITSQILFLLLSYISYMPDIAYWLEDEWEKDLHSSINLNYKAAWYILAYNKLQPAQSETDLSSELFNETIDYLLSEQRDDGSWGPWKSHPAPSECFITGICMASLAYSYRILKNPMIIKSLEKAVEWIKSRQLKNGLFPTHYIEEGSAWIFFGWTKALNVIQNNEL